MRKTKTVVISADNRDKGKTFLITRHGMPAAKLEPIQPVVDRQKITREVKAFLKMKKSKRLKSALRKV